MGSGLRRKGHDNEGRVMWGGYPAATMSSCVRFRMSHKI